MRRPVNLRAVTTVDINGSEIKPILRGTEFTITWLNDSDDSDNELVACCSGLGITMIWLNEFKLLDE